MKNYIGQSLWLLIWIVILTIGLQFIPSDVKILGAPLRPMDIFTDIRLETGFDSIAYYDSLHHIQDSLALLVDTVAIDSQVVQGPLPPVDSFYFGQVFEDYHPDQKSMAAFYNAVDSIQYGRHVRIAFFGDSFVEGDILIGDLRDSLQSLWGGDGVGYVPITSKVARFKRTLVHEYRGWDTHSIVSKENRRKDYGINGFIYKPMPGATVMYQGIGRWFEHTRSWSSMRLFYTGDSLAPISLRINQGEPELRTLPDVKGLLGVVDIRAPWMSQASLEFPEPGKLMLYGASLENGAGIYIDNFSVRGNSGGKLKLISKSMMQAFDKYQHYDLIVLQFGLNAASNSLRNIAWYQQELDETFKHMRLCFPDKPILVISVPDRGGKVDGELATMRSIPAIVDMQRTLARKHGFLFFDLFRGMGGPGAMIALANTSPMLANKDYTHLTHAGGKEVSYLFVRLLQEEHTRHKMESPHFEQKKSTFGSHPYQ
jgi:hypothetical protein